MNNEMQEGFINYIYNIKTIVIIIMYVFGIINCIMIAGIWAIRRKKDFIIMRTFGMKKRHILQNALKEFVGMTVCAMVVAVIISIGYVIISGEWNNVAGLNFRNIGIFLTALMLIMLLILVSLYMYIRDVKPAQGLREL
jgi:predicted lysophospholipase L1 biosynthesis ABC-type transport system permease subunit